jgi:hypothetical protein
MLSTGPFCRAVILLAVASIAAECAPHVAFASRRTTKLDSKTASFASQCRVTTK